MTPDLKNRTIDVAQLMADIQTRVSTRGERLDRYFEELRRSIDDTRHKWNLLEVNNSLREANELLHQLRISVENPAFGAPKDISFLDLGRLPGASRSWANPKRWASSAMRLLFRRQERFNVEVVRRLEQLEHAASFDQHMGVTIRLIGTLNALVMATSQADQVLSEWNARLCGWLCSVLEFIDITREPDASGNGSEKAARLLPPPLPPSILDDFRRACEVTEELSEAREGLARVSTSLAEQSRAYATRLSIIEQELGRQRQASSQLERELAAVERVIEKMIAAAEAESAVPSTSDLPRVGTPSPLFAKAHFDFLKFEDSTRGDEGQVAHEQNKYLEWFKSASIVLDAGCGRGEFLELLRDAGIPAYGIDSDQNMVSHCRSKKLRVFRENLVDHLRSIEDQVLGGIFLGQVVEHLAPEVLAAIFPLAYRKLVPGGSIVIETINPTCLTTFSGAFYADPTHVKPLHPKALEYFLDVAGFATPTVVFTSPVREEDRLVVLQENNPVDPAVKELVLQMNENLRKLNSLLYSYANYAIAARRPSGQ